MMKFPFPFLPEIYTHLRWDVCLVFFTTKGCCVEKFGLGIDNRQLAIMATRKQAKENMCIAIYIYKYYYITINKNTKINIIFGY
jgi:hypothetical protein